MCPSGLFCRESLLAAHFVLGSLLYSLLTLAFCLSSGSWKVLPLLTAARWHRVWQAALLLCHPCHVGLVHRPVRTGRLRPRWVWQWLHQRVPLRAKPHKRTRRQSHRAAQEPQVSGRSPESVRLSCARWVGIPCTTFFSRDWSQCLKGGTQQSEVLDLVQFWVVTLLLGTSLWCFCQKPFSWYSPPRLPQSTNLLVPLWELARGLSGKYYGSTRLKKKTKKTQHCNTSHFFLSEAWRPQKQRCISWKMPKSSPCMGWIYIMPRYAYFKLHAFYLILFNSVQDPVVTNVVCQALCLPHCDAHQALRKFMLNFKNSL